MAVPEWAETGLPLVGFLFVVVFFRAQSTYWIARALPELVERASGRYSRLKPLANWAKGPIPRKGASILERWGVLVIPLSFMTVGVQTAVLAGAGLVRMNWLRFTAAMLPGCVAWAFLYGFGLLAVWTAAVRAAAGSPWGWAVLALIVVIVALAVWLRKRHIANSALPAESHGVPATLPSED